jgi:hypothetical protein
MLLPFLEQKELWDEIDFELSALDSRNLDAATQIVSVFRCPTFSGPDFSQSPLYVALSPHYALRNYVAMGGTTIGKLWHKPNGVFYASSSTRLTDIKDGLSVTIFVSETREANMAVWIDGTAASLAGHPYNEDAPPDYAFPQTALNYSPFFISVLGAGNRVECQYGPSSMHPGGINHLFGDGSVHFISPEILPAVYDAALIQYCIFTSSMCSSSSLASYCLRFSFSSGADRSAASTRFSACLFSFLLMAFLPQDRMVPPASDGWCP